LSGIKKACPTYRKQLIALITSVPFQPTRHQQDAWQKGRWYNTGNVIDDLFQLDWFQNIQIVNIQNTLWLSVIKFSRHTG